MPNFVYLSNVCEKLAKGVLLYANSNNVLFCDPKFTNAVTRDHLKEFFFLGAFIVTGEGIIKAVSFSEVPSTKYVKIVSADSKEYYSKEYITPSPVGDVATDDEVDNVVKEVFGN